MEPGGPRQQRTDSSGHEQWEFPLAHLLERTFHSCLILILKLMLITDHHERMRDSQLKYKRHKCMKTYPRPPLNVPPNFLSYPLSGTENIAMLATYSSQPAISAVCVEHPDPNLSWSTLDITMLGAKCCALPDAAGSLHYMFIWDSTTAASFSSPKPKYCWGRKAEPLLSHRMVSLFPAYSNKTLTCNATVKWLVFVSRTILVFMADWMPHRHCKYPIVFLSRLRARTVVRPGRIPRDENCRAQFVVMKLGEIRKSSSVIKQRLPDGLKFLLAQEPCWICRDYPAKSMTPEGFRKNEKLI